jgi:hypothetical protein
LDVTVYRDAPSPVGPPIDQVKSVGPRFSMRNDWGAGAGPPHGAAKVSDEEVMTGPPPIPLPESERGAGRDSQMDPVAVIAMLPVTAGTAFGENVTDAACGEPLATVKAAGATRKGEEEPAGPFEDATSVTFAVPLPLLTTVKGCVADPSS